MSTRSHQPRSLVRSKNRSRSRRLFVERLEHRTPLAGDLVTNGYEMEIKLEIVDVEGHAITSVEVGDEFRLQARLVARDGVRPIDGYADFTFLDDLVAPLLDPTDLGVRFSEIEEGEIDEAGRMFTYSAMPDMILSKTFRALSTGTALFTSNPCDKYGFEIYTIGSNTPTSPSDILFGSATLEITGDEMIPPPEQPQGPRKIDFHLDLIGEEYAIYLLSGGMGSFIPSFKPLIQNGHILIDARNVPLGDPPATDEQLTALAEELQAKVGVTSWENFAGVIRCWVPIDRIRDLKLVTTLNYATHLSAPITDTTIPDPPGESPPVEEPTPEHAASVVVEILNQAGEVVSSVRVGEEFTVRARMLVNYFGDPFSAHLDLQISADLLELIQNNNDLGVDHSQFSDDELRGLGRMMNFTAHPDIIFSKTFRATAEGAATFSTNAGEWPLNEITYVGAPAPLDPSQVEFGSATLEILAADEEVPPVDPPGDPPPREEPTEAPADDPTEEPTGETPVEEPPTDEPPIEQPPGEDAPAPESPAEENPGSEEPVHEEPELRIAMYRDIEISGSLEPDQPILDTGSKTKDLSLLPLFTSGSSSSSLVASSSSSLSVQTSNFDSDSDWQLIADPEAAQKADGVTSASSTSHSETPALMDNAAYALLKSSRKKK